MREKTRFYKLEAEKDAGALLQHNNSKIEKRTREENERAYLQKQGVYRMKWERMLGDSETEAQELCCMRMLYRIETMPRFFR